MVEAKDERRAKLFMNGRSQAVRLPKEFRFEGTEVRIRRTGSGVLLEPVGTENGAGGLDEVLGEGPLDTESSSSEEETMRKLEEG